MGWKLLYRMEKRGRVAENYEKEFDEIYELDSAEDFNAFLVSFKKQGGVYAEERNGLTFYFTIDSVTIERRPATASGKVQAVATVRVSLLKTSSGLVPPWDLAPYSFRVSSVGVDETTNRFYPGVGDLLYSGGSSSAQALTNTAGSRLQARTTRTSSLIEFSYNTPVSSFDARLFWAAQGKINLKTVTICGMTFPPRTVRLDRFSARYSTETAETTDAQGNKTTTTWTFYKTDIALLANPRSYDQLFENVGTRVNRGGTLAQIWRWTSGGKAQYGTYSDYVVSGSRDGEPVAENMYLDLTGTTVSPVPTHRVGSAYEPVDFSELGLPSEAPSQWRVQ